MLSKLVHVSNTLENCLEQFKDDVPLRSHVQVILALTNTSSSHELIYIATRTAQVWHS